MKKSVRGLLLALAAAAALTLSALAAESGFARINTYAPGQFADVPEDIWCADNVKSAYEFGIMDGREEGRFDVGGSLTVAETITMACRIHSACTGADLPEGGGRRDLVPALSGLRRGPRRPLGVCRLQRPGEPGGLRRHHGQRPGGDDPAGHQQRGTGRHPGCGGGGGLL